MAFKIHHMIMMFPDPCVKSIDVKKSPTSSDGAAKTGPDQCPMEDANKLTIIKLISTRGTPKSIGNSALKSEANIMAVDIQGAF